MKYENILVYTCPFWGEDIGNYYRGNKLTYIKNWWYKHIKKLVKEGLAIRLDQGVYLLTDVGLKKISPICENFRKQCLVDLKLRIEHERKLSNQQNITKKVYEIYQKRIGDLIVVLDLLQKHKLNLLFVIAKIEKPLLVKGKGKTWLSEVGWNEF